MCVGTVPVVPEWKNIPWDYHASLIAASTLPNQRQAELNSLWCLFLASLRPFNDLQRHMRFQLPIFLDGRSSSNLELRIDKEYSMGHKNP